MDAVITYVDITERFIKDYNIYCKKNLQLNRFRSYGVLDLQIKLIRKYMPYIKNIFVIVSHEEQVEGIDLSDAKVITHDQIIPATYLPCFNSCTIEMFMWKIPGLSEEFVYFNDDTFVIDNVHHTKWFVKGKPCLNPTIHNVNKYETNAYKKNCERSTEVIASLLNTDEYKGKYITQAHIARPFLKSTCETVFNKKIIEIQRSLTRTRHSKNVNATLFNDYDYISDNYYNIDTNYTYLKTFNEPEEIKRNIITKEYPLLCVNDNDLYIDFDTFKLEIRNALEANLNGETYKKPKEIKVNKSTLTITDKLIVSFTSWPKRIQYCKHTIDLMMNQTIIPDKIILNLSEEEFPNNKYDLPIELVNEEIDNDKFEIYWVKENTTVWKKIIPTMDRFPNDLVFSIDDDIEYPSNYIEEMYKTYCENNKLYPVVGYEFMIDNNLCHSGPFTLTSKKFYGDLLNKIYNDLILPTLPDKKWQSDIVYYKVLNVLGYKYIKCESINGNSIYKNSELNKENRYSIWDKLFKDERKENIKLINTYFVKNYSILFKKKIVYTCITGNYDNLLEPEYVTPGFDYICFTDNKKLKSNTWKILPIPDNLLDLSKVKQQRNIKINPHKYLNNYELSIWVDSSVKLSDNLNKLLCTLDLKNYNIFITQHPQRNCVYKEAEACIKLKKDTLLNINKEIDFFKSSGLPENNGLVETNVIIRLHNDISCIALMGEWWYYLNMYSHRDQLSLPFCLWKLNYKQLCIMPVGFNHTSYFNWIGGLHKKINICIIHYNTPELTDALIKSINKNVKRAFIYLFDNSTTKPFINRYDNMLYLDNTKGQYIDFDKWLDKYPNRKLSKDHIGNSGSARHSISVQKCMEIIDDNFILMDSDILLKRDVSGFVNSKYIYVGQSEKQGNGKYRVLPFCLYINVKMCKKYNVPWFDENYMHGLYVTKEADRYDTGGAFYVHTRDIPFKEVDLNSFIVHYKGGSWEEKYMKIHNLTLTSKEWLEINKKYWE